jgi:hypothetical protein
MIKIQITGGLGNQMFQYAAAKKAAVAHGTGILCDITSLRQRLKRHGKQYVFRDFKLNHFNVHLQESALSQLSTYDLFKNSAYLLQLSLNKISEKLQIRSFFKEKTPFRYDDRFDKITSQAYLSGYFQNERYFKGIEDILRKEFTLKKPLSEQAKKWMKIIMDAPLSIAFHVRRGDYVLDDATMKYHGFCDITYYEEAYQVMSKAMNTKSFEIFVFSDDVEWVKNNLSFSSATHYVSGDSLPDYEEQMLMSACNHQVIANSSFSWWGAWLNKNPEKIVIAPKRWIANETVDASDIYPEGWRKI